ncbi:TetR/AcrR family transcriptional regulator [Mycobacterium sp. smrl_JER01]|uniref:TetR/AcrR family transcriptional regulator n=1 Tax=Mycobacterium sp. smrl_JER01 TaxID=3402633 RepID=UPI003ACD71FC
MSSPNIRRPARAASSVRRTPTQERSLALVRKVLEATAQVLADVGLDGMSTNKIAARAGVSIGSVYQYFPNKEALLDALVDDRVKRLEALAAGRMEAYQTHSYADATEAMLRATIEFCTTEPQLASILFARIAVPPNTACHVSAARNVLGVTRSYLLRHGDELGVPDVDLAATMSTHVIAHFAPWIALSIEPEVERERMIEEVVRMLSLWITAPRQR